MNDTNYCSSTCHEPDAGVGLQLRPIFFSFFFFLYRHRTQRVSKCPTHNSLERAVISRTVFNHHAEKRILVAHKLKQNVYMDFGVGVAREGWLLRACVLSCTLCERHVIERTSCGKTIDWKLISYTCWYKTKPIPLEIGSRLTYIQFPEPVCELSEGEFTHIHACAPCFNLEHIADVKKPRQHSCPQR